MKLLVKKENHNRIVLGGCGKCGSTYQANLWELKTATQYNQPCGYENSKCEVCGSWVEWGDKKSGTQEERALIDLAEVMKGHNIIFTGNFDINIDTTADLKIHAFRDGADFEAIGGLLKCDRVK